MEALGGWLAVKVAEEEAGAVLKEKAATAGTIVLGGAHSWHCVPGAVGRSLGTEPSTEDSRRTMQNQAKLPRRRVAVS